MNKKQIKKLAKHLVTFLMEGNLYNIFDGAIGFFHAKPEQFLERAMSLADRIDQREIHLRRELLEGVSVYYMSESKSETSVGWVDKAHCLNQFFTDATLSECEDWKTMANAISYQYNVAGKVHRLAALVALAANSVSDEHKVRRSMLWTVENMMYQFHDHMLDNIYVIRQALEENGRMISFSMWYNLGGRRMMLDTEAKDKKAESLVGNYWVVPKLDAFFKGESGVQYDYTAPIAFIKDGPKLKYTKQLSKQKKETNIREHAIKMLLEDMLGAYESMTENESNKTAKGA